jgi:hypothetical protein
LEGGSPPAKPAILTVIGLLTFKFFGPNGTDVAELRVSIPTDNANGRRGGGGGGQNGARRSIGGGGNNEVEGGGGSGGRVDTSRRGRQKGTKSTSHVGKSPGRLVGTISRNGVIDEVRAANDKSTKAIIEKLDTANQLQAIDNSLSIMDADLQNAASNRDAVRILFYVFLGLILLPATFLICSMYHLWCCCCCWRMCRAHVWCFRCWSHFGVRVRASAMLEWWCWVAVLATSDRPRCCLNWQCRS